MDAVTVTPSPVNEPVLNYAPGSDERARTLAEVARLGAAPLDIPHVIGGQHVHGATGEKFEVVAPHRHSHVLATAIEADHADATAAVEAAIAAAPAWRATSFDERAAILLRAADLLSGPWRAILVAATMLGQSKTLYQAEIDAAAELADFWRFNVAFAREILTEQPISSPGVWNRMDHRPLDGFVYAVTPFNFTAIAGNLPTAPALMGNTVVWKPSPTQTLTAYLTMQLLEEAGLPAGVINMVTGSGTAVSDVVLADPRLAGLHFTGSTATFKHFWQQIGTTIDRYQSYPRLVGETGGKDFVLAHPSADPEILSAALIRGAFEYQGQKCSAASRAYLPESLWATIRDDFLKTVSELSYGDVADPTNFGGAVIDRRSYDKNVAAIERAKAAEGVAVHGGAYDDSEGFFVHPTVLEVPAGDEALRTEYFGPILAITTFPDEDFDRMFAVIDGESPYALTGSIISRERAAIDRAMTGLRSAAGNFYINDKPTGAVVGQQPFGGGRASGTNDKAGSPMNLLRWVSPRTIKETFVPARTHTYPHMEA
ncbi:L-glutamate gamma-semialdehyde dehydrogenase [Millisia brevis]|uniref:L-glutamate gamma-semialdehyde dehydrogenase n=1 Tax=Millisia brevis TaxID=264148 RepID=UPI00082B1F8B|nr:L-glutamate gamma-semialdehyde dehydrogenase [Millisia brevis]